MVSVKFVMDDASVVFASLIHLSDAEEKTLLRSVAALDHLLEVAAGASSAVLAHFINAKEKSALQLWTISWESLRVMPAQTSQP